MKAAFALSLGWLAAIPALAGPYAPAAGQPGSTAIAHDDPQIIAWGSAVGELVRGPQQIGDPDLGNATFGSASFATGPANATTSSPFPVVSLGDGGWLTMNFAQPITNGTGADFAVFENSFSDSFLELAFVEVSSDGVHYFRFPSISLTQTTTQVNGDDLVGPFGSVDPTNINNLAGKYRASFGTPFDLQDLAGVSLLLDVTHVTQVRVVDVIGMIAPVEISPGVFVNPSLDSQGHIINDPWATPFGTSGFDLDAIGVIHQVPEPATGLLLGLSLTGLLIRRRR